MDWEKCIYTAKAKDGSIRTFDMSKFVLSSDGHQADGFDDYVYKINFCKETLSCPNYEQKFTIIQTSKDGNMCFPLGKLEGSKIGPIVNDDVDSGLLLQYGDAEDDDGIIRNTELFLKCDNQTDDIKITFLQEWALVYSFEFYHKAFCNLEETSEKTRIIPGLGIGGLLLILAVVGLLLYFIIGILVKKFKFGASGRDVIPQVEFWLDLPILVKDGIVFIGSCMKEVFEKIFRRGKYTPV
jgi:uncharacterized protein with PQ loop repeat